MKKRARERERERERDDNDDMIIMGVKLRNETNITSMTIAI
jgi:hypothetical protein